MARDWDSHDAWEDENEEEQPHAPGVAGMLEKLRNAPWVKEHPNLLKGIGVGVSLVLMVLLLGRQARWWSGEAEPAAPAVAEQPGQQGQPQPPAQPTPGRQASPAGKSKESPQSAEKNPQKHPEKENVKQEEPRPVPDDVAQWKKEDYFRARQENNPKLIEAVARLGEKTRGSIPAAQGLTDLLKPLPPEPPPTSGPTPPAPGVPAAAPVRRRRLLRRRRPVHRGRPLRRRREVRAGAVAPGAGRTRRRARPRRRPWPHRLPGRAIRPNCKSWWKRSSPHWVTTAPSWPARRSNRSYRAFCQPTTTRRRWRPRCEALVAHPGPENDALLVRVIAAPEAAPAGRSPGTVARQRIAQQGVGAD